MDPYLGLAQSKSKPRSVLDGFSNRHLTAVKGGRPSRPPIRTNRPVSTSSLVEPSEHYRLLQQDHLALLKKQKQLEESYSSLEERFDKLKLEYETLQSAYEELQENYSASSQKNFTAGKLLVYLKLKRRADKSALENRNIIKNEACFNTFLKDVIMADHPRIPRVIYECVSVLESNEKFLTVPGLYRVSGDYNVIQNLRYDINANQYKKLRKLKSPHEVCGIIKLFLRELKDPLVSLQMCSEIISSVEELKSNKRAKVLQLVNALDDLRLQTLKFLMKHLRNVANTAENEMDAYSLGLLMSSCIFNETLADVCPVKFEKQMRMYWTVFLLLGVIISLLALFDWKAKRYDSVPGPRRWPFIGNVVSFLGVGPVEIFAQLIALGKTYGKVYKLDFFYDYTIVYSSPEAVEAIVTSPVLAAKSQDYDKVSEWIGNGLLVSRGPKWFSRRKVITPGFHFKILEDFVPSFNRQAEAFCRKLEALAREPGREAIDIFPELKLLTLGIICETAMGVDSAEDTAQQAYYTRIVEELSSILYWRMFNVFVNIDALFRLTSTSRRFDELVRKSWNFTLNMIDKRRKINEDTLRVASPDERKDETYGRHKRALLDTLLDARIDGKPLTDDDIREEVDTFTFAGHDTTASAMTFLLYNVAKHPDVQDRLYEEILDEFGPESTELTLSMINNLRYMDLVIKESLRLYPPVPIIARIATENTEVLGERITRGTSVAVDIFLMHRSEEYFLDPDRFDPTRFEGMRDTDTFNPYTYIPFSAGSRNCIGQKFAQYEMKSVLVKILQHFSVRLTRENYEPTLKAEIVLKPATGLPLKFVRRH
ncbi:cytochrome P450 [Anopheles darlingi]|uniref:Cytochrome P450 n=1 Tax=Anopheles darlingi TaxID=43151 RepID=W5JVD8_ANODA|nr:cytochrome P450 [Anopheles darlingi]